MISYDSIKVLPENFVRVKMEEYYQEDAPSGDITTMGTINHDQMASAYLQAEEDLVFAGYYIILYAFSKNIDVNIKVQDGDRVKKGEIIAEIEGPAAEILTRERVVLNMLQRLSGIATTTAKYAEKAKEFGVKILDTRKTTPGFRLFEKYAVTCGGGTNHRLDLSSGILIKDNHIEAAGGIRQAIEKMKALQGDLPIEIEVETKEQIIEALDTGVSGLLLDNMNRVETKDAVEIVRKHPGGDNIFIESSGGINYDNFEKYLDTGINAISIGALTHSYKSSDIHLEFKK